MASKTEATLTPLVAAGLALIAALPAKVLARDAAAKALQDSQAVLDALNAQLVALGAGRYRDDADHTCLVVAAILPVMSADKFALAPTKDAIATARDLSGDSFLKLFDRTISFWPKEGFGGIAAALLTPAKARDLTALCIVPGKLTGGRCAFVKWR